VYYDEQERFEEFLKIYKDKQGRPIYWNRVQQMSINDEKSLTVDFSDLAQFEIVFTIIAKDDPRGFLRIANNALVSVLKVEDPDYVASIDISDIEVHFINFGNMGRYVPIRLIRSEHIENLIEITGIIESLDNVKIVMTVGIFLCRICHTEVPYEQERIFERPGQHLVLSGEPPLCPICMKKTPFRLIPEKSKFIDRQDVRIQESPDQIPPDDDPASIDLILEGDLIGLLKPGDYASFTGILKLSPDIPAKSDRMPSFGQYLQVNGLKKILRGKELKPEELKRVGQLFYESTVNNDMSKLEGFDGWILRKFQYGRYSFEWVSVLDKPKEHHQIWVYRDRTRIALIRDGEYISIT